MGSATVQMGHTFSSETFSKLEVALCFTLKKRVCWSEDQIASD